MASRDHRHGAQQEPQYKQRTFSADTSEEKAAEDLQRERAAVDPEEERAKHSVFDEPAIFPNRPKILIEDDWYCRNCGYNLRGLMTGHPCPECGKIERYEPPREGEVTYARWQAGQRPGTSTSSSGILAVAVMLVGIPMGLVGGSLTVEYFGFIQFVLFGPLISEVLKVSTASILIERKPHWLRGSVMIYWIAVGTALLFAAAQNATYLWVFFTTAPREQVVYRWMIGPMLHVLCTVIASRGLVVAWLRTNRDQSRFRLALAFPYILAAIVAHGAFNAYVFAKGFFGYGF